MITCCEDFAFTHHKRDFALRAIIIGCGYVYTTIRLPEELKARVAAAAKRSGTTTHSFILEAIAKKTKQDDLCAEFDVIAENRYACIVATEKTISWQEMRRYLEDRLVGKEVERLVARKLARLNRSRVMPDQGVIFSCAWSSNR